MADTFTGRLSGRLLLGGLPAVFATGLASFTPLLGLGYLNASTYQVWALASVLFTVFLVFDFGAPVLATKLASESSLTRRAFSALTLLSVAVPIGLGLVALILWPAYARAADISDSLTGEFVVTLAWVTAGSVLRSVGSLFAASALGGDRFSARALILVLGSATQAIATLVALESGAGLHSLGIGLFAGGVVQTFVGLVTECRHLVPGVVQDNQVMVLIGRFFRAKSATAVLGLTVTQLDRWALGLVAASPSFVVAYDVAARVGMMPKIALLALSAGTVSEVSRLRTRDAVTDLYRTLLRGTMALSILGAVGAVAVVACISLWGDGTSSLGLAVLIAIPVCLGHAIHCWTIPGVNTVSALGSPRYELLYMIPLGVLTFGVYLVAAATHSVTLFVMGWSLVLGASSAMFAWRTPRFIASSWEARNAR
ncbi:hypothetical protein [Aeromicrobium sp.]|uniref:hypothetical protein n=1 Tax=Aeromicrobium sp. TaxID=1871063 RepID=UPI0028A8060F|nr:hypothetical protein [Aeromicrobium sp.]